MCDGGLDDSVADSVVCTCVTDVMGLRARNPVSGLSVTSCEGREPSRLLVPVHAEPARTRTARVGRWLKGRRRQSHERRTGCHRRPDPPNSVLGACGRGRLKSR